MMNMKYFSYVVYQAKITDLVDRIFLLLKKILTFKTVIINMTDKVIFLDSFMMKHNLHTFYNLNYRETNIGVLNIISTRKSIKFILIRIAS